MELRFEPPGPGSWELDPVHFPRPVTRYWTEMHPDALRRGVQDFTRFYGMLIDTLDYQYVNGFAYKTVRPVSEDDVPERFKRVDDVFKRKLWREQLHDWDEKIKPTSFKAHRELQSVDPEKLSNEDLITHLTRCRNNHAAMISQHMRFTAAALVPTGDFLAHIGEWTGLSTADLLGLLRGSAPVSAGASAELARLTAAMAKDPQAQKLLALNDEPGAILQRLRSLEGEAGTAASAYLDLIGYRLLDGFDISEPYAFELPDALLRAIRVAVAGKSHQSSNVEERVASVRMRVPERHRAEFDELLNEARLTYRIRDERGVYSDIWASGIMRRAVLAGGRGLATKGRIHDPKHFVDAGFEEMRSLLSDGHGPASDELAARFQYRASHRAKEAPQTLGPPAPPPPELSGLPPAAARMMRAIHIALSSLFESSEAPHNEHTLRGLAASRGIYEGPARRVSSPAEFDRIVRGDVLVTESTTEAFNILLLSSALSEIWWSANSDSAITYRKRVGLFTRPSVGVVVQALLNPDTAGVMFTRNPVTDADERVIEASWGLGEAVVAGIVIPDHYRVARSGQVLERTPGVKTVAVRSLPNGGTIEEKVAAELVERLCLKDDQLHELNQLAGRCELVYGPGRDVEWALAAGTLYLLQCRAITVAGH